MKRKTIHLLIAGAGIALMAAGLFVLKNSDLSQGIWQVLPYCCLGVGSGLFGHGTGELIAQQAISRDPALQRQLTIEQKDERNIAIANRAKSKAFDMMTFVFGALMVCFALMQIEMSAVLLLVFCYLLVQGTALYYHTKFEKEM